jgi:oxygen-independent coproporphyrinogen-3 oxidase
LRREELCGEFMLNALRLEEGFSLTRFKHRTGLAEADLQPQLEQLLQRGLLQQQGEQVSATELGGRFLDTVVSQFLTD